MNFSPFFLSAELGLITTIVLFVMVIPMVYGIHFFSGKWAPIWKALASLPLILPPTVLGYYLLIALRPDGWVAQLTGLELAFSFEGLVVGSALYSLPFMLTPILTAIENLPDSYEEAAFTLGKNRWQTYTRVLLPCVKPSLLAASVLTFAHTIGEFGVILMIGGNIPDETRVASIAIYHEVEALHYATADRYALILLGFSLVVLLGVYGKRLN